MKTSDRRRRQGETSGRGRRWLSMIRLRSSPSAPVLEIEVSGRITRADVETAFAAVDAAIGEREAIRILEQVGPLDGIEPMALWRDLQLGLPLMKRFSHAALVTDARWLDALTKLAAAFTPAQVRVFPTDQLEAARAWLAESGSPDRA